MYASYPTYIIIHLYIHIIQRPCNADQNQCIIEHMHTTAFEKREMAGRDQIGQVYFPRGLCEPADLFFSGVGWARHLIAFFQRATMRKVFFFKKEFC